MNSKVVTFESLTRMAFFEEEVTLVSGPASFGLGWPPLFDESLDKYVSFADRSILLTTRTTHFVGLVTIATMRMTAARSDRLIEAIVACGAQEGGGA